MSHFSKVLALIFTTVIIFAIFLWFVSTDNPISPYILLSCFASLGIYSMISDILFILRWHNLGEDD